MQTYFNNKTLVRWNTKQPNGMKHYDCECPVEYIRIDKKLYEVHYCGRD